MIEEESPPKILQQIIYYSDCAIVKDTLILLRSLERMFKFVMSDKSLIKRVFGKSLSATPTKRLRKMHWLQVHKITYTDKLILTLMPL